MYVFFVVLHFFPSLAPLSKMPKDSITSVFFEIDSGLENLQKNLPTLKIKKSGLLLRCFRKHTFVVLQMLVLKSERIRGHKKGIERAKSLGLITCLFRERVGY